MFFAPAILLHPLLWLVSMSKQSLPLQQPHPTPKTAVTIPPEISLPHATSRLLFTRRAHAEPFCLFHFQSKWRMYACRYVNSASLPCKLHCSIPSRSDIACLRHFADHCFSSFLSSFREEEITSEEEGCWVPLRAHGVFFFLFFSFFSGGRVLRILHVPSRYHSC